MLIFLFVFINQMTSYEMRISDWSSDVCSADLGAVAAARFFRAGDRRIQLERCRAGPAVGPRQRPLRALGSRPGTGHAPDPGAGGPPAGRRAHAENGIASCRERVLQ